MAASRALRPSPRYAALIEARRQRIADLTGAPLGRCLEGCWFEVLMVCIAGSVGMALGFELSCPQSAHRLGSSGSASLC